MSSEQDPTDAIPNEVSYQPLPNIYRAFAAGASPYAILTEAIDNAIDYVRTRALDGEVIPDNLAVDIDYEEGTDDSPDRLIITDNAGGVPPDELQRFFQLGYTDTPPHSIGTFGVGAKRLIGLGNRLKYESHALGYDVGVGFEVDAANLESADNQASEDVYQSETYRVDGLDEGQTRIIVEQLDNDVWRALTELHPNDDESEGVESVKGAEETLWRLEETYERFLTDGIDVSHDPQNGGRIDFDIQWSGPEYSVNVTPPEEVELSYLPIDGLVPRRYEGMPFADTDDVDPDSEDALRVDIEVGLMTNSDSENAGLTVTMNDRNILFRDTDNEFFTTHYLGNYRGGSGHGRLYCRIDITGESSEMPWSDLKDGIDTSRRVTRRILSVADNALREYKTQTYTNLKGWILEAYPSTEAHAANGGHIKVIDKQNSKLNNPRFNDKPGEGSRRKNRYPERDRLTETIRLHHELRIHHPEILHPSLQVAYNHYFEEYYGTDDGYDLPEDDFTVMDPVDIDSPDEGLGVDHHEIDTGSNPDPSPVAERIEALAKQHATFGDRVTDDSEGYPNWAQPRYDEELAQALGRSDLTELNVLDSLDDPLEETDDEPEDKTEDDESSSGPTETETTRDSSETSSPSEDSSSDGEPDDGSSSESETDTQVAASTTGTDSGEQASITSSSDADADDATQDDTTDSTTDTPTTGTGTTAVLVMNGDRYNLPEEELGRVADTRGLVEPLSPETLFGEMVEAVEEADAREQRIEHLESDLEETEAELDEKRDELQEMREKIAGLIE